jgi:NAD+ kinase
MRHVAIIYKRMRPEAAKLAEDLGQWFVKRNISVLCEENIDNSGVSCLYRKIDIPKSVEMVIVVGGDGTFLSVARFIENRSTPVIGINLGGLGFLTEVSAESCFVEFEKILAGDFEIEERMRLRVSVTREGKEMFSHRVLNDAVINKGALARIVDLQTTIDGRLLTHYRGDGLIISTPTGSTAYNISAGGPIVFPTAHAIIITPICPFTLTNRPIILPAHVTILIELAEPATDVTLTCDGQVGCLINSTDHISITAAATPVRLIKPPDVDHFEVLRTKLKWGQL